MSDEENMALIKGLSYFTPSKNQTSTPLPLIIPSTPHGKNPPFPIIVELVSLVLLGEIRQFAGLAKYHTGTVY